VKIARRRIVKAPKPTKMSACPICKSHSGFCFVGVLVPRQWWGRRSTRSPRSK